MHDIIVREARESDFASLAAMDLRYPASRVLRLSRRQDEGTLAFVMTWTEREAPPALYNEYSVDRLRGATTRADAFFVAEADGIPAALLMIVLPPWTDAAEITDLAVDAAHRRRGLASALIARALSFATERRLRAVWVEPRSDNAGAIDFYLALGFRISGFNDRMYSNSDHDDGRLTVFMYREL